MVSSGLLAVGIVAVAGAVVIGTLAGAIIIGGFIERVPPLGPDFGCDPSNYFPDVVTPFGDEVRDVGGVVHPSGGVVIPSEPIREDSAGSILDFVRSAFGQPRLHDCPLGILAPENILVEDNSIRIYGGVLGANATFSPIVVGGDPTTSFSCDPASGSIFKVDDEPPYNDVTMVECTATDKSDTVTVKFPIKISRGEFCEAFTRGKPITFTANCYQDPWVNVGSVAPVQVKKQGDDITVRTARQAADFVLVDVPAPPGGQNMEVRYFNTSLSSSESEFPNVVRETINLIDPNNPVDIRFNSIEASCDGEPVENEPLNCNEVSVLVKHDVSDNNPLGNLVSEYDFSAYSAKFSARTDFNPSTTELEPVPGHSFTLNQVLRLPSNLSPNVNITIGERDYSQILTLPETLFVPSGRAVHVVPSLPNVTGVLVDGLSNSAGPICIPQGDIPAALATSISVVGDCQLREDMKPIENVIMLGEAIDGDGSAESASFDLSRPNGQPYAHYFSNTPQSCVQPLGQPTTSSCQRFEARFDGTVADSSANIGNKPPDRSGVWSLTARFLAGNTESSSVIEEKTVEFEVDDIIETPAVPANPQYPQDQPDPPEGTAMFISDVTTGLIWMLDPGFEETPIYAISRDQSQSGSPIVISLSYFEESQLGSQQGWVNIDPMYNYNTAIAWYNGVLTDSNEVDEQNNSPQPMMVGEQTNTSCTTGVSACIHRAAIKWKIKLAHDNIELETPSEVTEIRLIYGTGDDAGNPPAGRIGWVNIDPDPLTHPDPDESATNLLSHIECSISPPPASDRCYTASWDPPPSTSPLTQVLGDNKDTTTTIDTQAIMDFDTARGTDPSGTNCASNQDCWYAIGLWADDDSIGGLGGVNSFHRIKSLLSPAGQKPYVSIDWCVGTWNPSPGSCT